MPFFEELSRALPEGTVFGPGTPAFGEATSPDNASFPQKPDVVVRPRSAADVGTAVAMAGAAGLRVAVQATGHGAGGPIGAGTVLIDTSSLDAISIDPDARTARVGAGVTWAQVQEQAQKHGLLGLSGTSPTVGVAGYTVHGGVGWLVRPYGLASASLRAVTYVDGHGRVREAGDEVLWAFRGGAAAGIATELEFSLYAVPELWAGYLLWPVAHRDALVRAWTAQLDSAPAGLTSTVGILHLPPKGPFPEDLLGTTVVHLSYASIDGEAGLAAMRAAMRAVAEPVADTTGPADAAALSTIHLDPPAAVPARGMGEWLGPAGADQLLAIFEAAGIGDGLNMIEVRHVAPGNLPPAVDGALTSVPGPFLLHTVGGSPDDDGRRAIDARLARVAAAAAPVAAGLAAPAFRDGQPDAGDAYPAASRDRLLAILEQADPGRVLIHQRSPYT
jgi:FAD/FMN-containing dehydrogenase